MPSTSSSFSFQSSSNFCSSSSSSFSCFSSFSSPSAHIVLQPAPHPLPALLLPKAPSNHSAGVGMSTSTSTFSLTKSRHDYGSPPGEGSINLLMFIRIYYYFSSRSTSDNCGPSYASCLHMIFNSLTEFWPNNLVWSLLFKYWFSLSYWWLHYAQRNAYGLWIYTRRWIQRLHYTVKECLWVMDLHPKLDPRLHYALMECKIAALPLQVNAIGQLHLTDQVSQNF